METQKWLLCGFSQDELVKLGIKTFYQTSANDRVIGSKSGICFALVLEYLIARFNGTDPFVWIEEVIPYNYQKLITRQHAYIEDQSNSMKGTDYMNSVSRHTGWKFTDLKCGRLGTFSGCAYSLDEGHYLITLVFEDGDSHSIALSVDNDGYNIFFDPNIGIFTVQRSSDGTATSEFLKALSNDYRNIAGSPINIWGMKTATKVKSTFDLWK